LAHPDPARVDGDFLSRDDLALAGRLDARLDQVAGLRYEHLAPAANLHMSARLDELWALRQARADSGPRLGLVPFLARATALGLEADPLLGCLFDGRDRLERPARARVGISLDAGDSAAFLVLDEPLALGLQEIDARVREAVLRARIAQGPGLRESPAGPAPDHLRRRRRIAMLAREARERLAYLVPGEVDRRFAAHADQQGHLCVHNLGPLGVDAFKGFLRRPAVAGLWALALQRRVVRRSDGAFGEERRLPLVLVFSQDLVPLDRACAFLRGVIARLESPTALWEGT
jgi:pyruvate/2-oxoglutarate dehydrogenase complex dihydrolipoamide acyltransferase (E2) component